ncbi:C4-dicarboxylate transporter substrate binding protein [Bacillus sp. OxB-1]|uniref:TRAP transporter substrate-binding protein DctP n=1 Tax=Bacillus sp. (strain OxB-1) TaxID=98228 RepID=UPI000581BEE8|nr:TRAP transporter substrate-binding protein DctP [Bacillus sp. OxB-1]BAQ09129.1 C4-dicarboxylate transporter substrate binding protein [Bacillus sp. OxB-1]
MRRKNLLFVLFLLIVVTVLAACGDDAQKAEGSTPSKENDEVIKIKVGHQGAPTDAVSLGFEGYAKKVEEATEGRVQFEIHGNGSLGGERDLAEQIQMGNLDMSVLTTGIVGNFANELRVFDMPFLFRDLDHAYTVLDSEIGQEMLDGMESSGFKGIAFWENGVRQFANNVKPIKSPEDMKGLKMRTIENEVLIDSYKSLGADAVPMAYPELFSSLQQGVVDGHDQGLTILYTSALYEVQNYVSEAGFTYASMTLLMNNKFYESLPEDIQKIIVEIGKDYASEQRALNQELDADAKKNMEEAGVIITEASEIDTEAFRKAVEPVYEKHGKKFGDYIQRISDM